VVYRPLRCVFGLARGYNSINIDVKVHDGQDSVIIATASSSSSGSSSIRLWQWRPPVDDIKRGSQNIGWSLNGIVEGLLKVIIVIAAAAYFIDIIRGQVGMGAVKSIKALTCLHRCGSTVI